MGTLGFMILVLPIFAQNSFSKKIHYGSHDNLSTYLGLFNDTFYIPAMVANSVQPSPFSASLLKIDITGNILSQSFYSKSGASIFPDLALVKSRTNKFFTSASISHGNDVVSALVAFDQMGDTIFVKSFGDTIAYNFMNWILKKTNEPNKLLLFGVSDSLCGGGHTGYCHPIIRVVDTLGNLITTRSYITGTSQRTLENADTAENNGYVFSGFEQQSSNGTGQAYVMKIDSNLNQVWLNRFFSPGSSIPNIRTLKSGEHILAYASLDSIFQGWAFFSRLALAKIDQSGNVIWTKKYGSLEKNASVNSVKELPNGDLVACGIIDISTGNSNYPKQLAGFILRTDNLGNEKWLQTYRITNTNDLAGQNYLYDLTFMADGGYAALGYVVSTDTSAQLTWLLRVDSMGCLNYGCNPFSINNLEIVDKISVYPVPFFDKINIASSVNAEQKAQVIDILTGRILIEVEMNSQITELDTKTLPQGLYIIKIFNSQKLVKIFKALKG